MKYSKLPETCYFWRKGSPVRWLRAYDNVIYSLDEPNVEKTLKNIDETVLLDPVYCNKCIEHLLFKSGDFFCDVCGARYSGYPSENEVKRIVTEWTKNPNPHL